MLSVTEKHNAAMQACHDRYTRGITDIINSVLAEVNKAEGTQLKFCISQEKSDAYGIKDRVRRAGFTIYDEAEYPDKVPASYDFGLVRVYLRTEHQTEFCDRVDLSIGGKSVAYAKTRKDASTTRDALIAKMEWLNGLTAKHLLDPWRKIPDGVNGMTFEEIDRFFHGFFNLGFEDEFRGAVKSWMVQRPATRPVQGRHQRCDA